MIGRYRVALGETQMDSLDDNLLILDVQYPPLRINRQTAETAGLDGLEVSHESLQQRTVVVTFELHIYDIAKRNAACQKINDWAAAGGILRTNDREGQYLQVACDQFAEIQSAKNWTKPLTLIFGTRENPYWISETQKTVTLAGKSAKGNISMDGNVKSAKVSVTATAQETVKSFQVTVGDTKIKITGISLSAGQKLIIDYQKDRYLRIRAAGKDAMSKMDASSSDLLLAPCGQKTAVGFTAGGRMTVVFNAKGMWR